MNELDRKRVATRLATSTGFMSPYYETFARAVLYLVNKYGTGEAIECDLGTRIASYDKEFNDKFPRLYIGAWDIANILNGSSELTEEQKNNRKMIMEA